MEKRIGHYTIVSELGRGGMGVVYKAHEESLNRFVALKVLGQHLSEDESYVERFKREAQSAAALNHPNIVQIYSIDDFDGRHCFAMEYVQGTSIQQMIKNQGPMEPAVAARLILQAASGLGAAHNRGIIHRDIKPANLMVDERGIVKIADFGLALLAAGATRLTATGMFMGTPGYLSPEQCLDQDVDKRADIYSLGVTLYEMLTGTTPFKADSPLALLRQIIDVEPKDVGDLRPEVPEELRTILRKMMAKDREERYSDCAPLVADLQTWLETTGATATDLSAVVAAATVAAVPPPPPPEVPAATATPEALNTDPTMRVDSAQLPGSPPPPPSSAATPAPGAENDGPRETGETSQPEMIATPISEEHSSGGGSRVFLGLAIAAGLIILFLGIGGFAAWHFGAFDALKDMIAGTASEDETVAQAIIDAEPELDAGEVAQPEPGAALTEENELDEHGALSEKLEVIPRETTKDPKGQPIEKAPSESVASIPAGAPTSQNAGAPAPGKNHQPKAQVSQPPPQPAIGTGVALISVGETLLAGVASDYVSQSLERRGVDVFDAMGIPGVTAVLEGGTEGGSLEDLLRPHARYLVIIRADYTGDRELTYMGRYETEFQARLHLNAVDLLDGRKLGPGIHAPIGYTQLSVDKKVANLLGPKFRKIAGRLQD